MYKDQGEWKGVRAEAAARGYDIEDVGAGCADDHPVRSVHWYDVVKWCNLKSEIEGLTPVYTISDKLDELMKLKGFRIPVGGCSEIEEGLNAFARTPGALGHPRTGRARHLARLSGLVCLAPVSLGDILSPISHKPALPHERGSRLAQENQPDLRHDPWRRPHARICDRRRTSGRFTLRS